MAALSIRGPRLLLEAQSEWYASGRAGHPRRAMIATDVMTDLRAWCHEINYDPILGYLDLKYDAHIYGMDIDEDATLPTGTVRIE
jgi:hypothetical protein